MLPETTPEDDGATATPARDRRPADRVALRADLRVAVPDATAAVVVTAAVFAFLYARMESGDSATVAVMPFMDDAGTYWMYLLSQAFGWSGLLWAWGTVMFGLLLSGPRPARLPVSRQVLERWHRTTSLTSMALMFAHALMFAAEHVRYEPQLAWAERLWAGCGCCNFPSPFCCCSACCGPPDGPSDWAHSGGARARGYRAGRCGPPAGWSPGRSWWVCSSWWRPAVTAAGNARPSRPRRARTLMSPNDRAAG
ncbi:hypothetical protein ABT319_27795 [Streptomyces sp. NPDC000678]|uniref:hypothetical protein n=1 Tax=Streptomyces sp. NPDC000678 TaxID=3154268 RepID=UPI0031D64599